MSELNVELRPFVLEDAPAIAQLVGDEAVSKWTSNIPHPYSEEDAKNWLNQSAGDSSRFPFAVELNGQLVACVSFWPYPPNGTEVGYWVGREFWGRGVGTAALKELMAHDSFPRDALVYARVMLGNVDSQRVLEKCGFSVFGKGECSKSGEEIAALVYMRAPAT